LLWYAATIDEPRNRNANGIPHLIPHFIKAIEERSQNKNGFFKEERILLLNIHSIKLTLILKYLRFI
jgi:hypothetical protein